jgi:isopentenyl diphosphate isomerase/L-lactate dehydrogenase-like FMN-dependent dehydrogenase
MVGRPVLWGLAVDGADGARRVVEILLTEFDVSPGLVGAPVARRLDRTFVTRAIWAGAHP